ncbi:MAG: phosphatidate cytidylyltransferase [Acidobacteriota bacterium]|nr:phosphatidate cytidylyltransferase [Acidobacteriota bacterium]
MKRILTAAVALPLVALALFFSHGPWPFLFLLVVIEVAVVEFVRLALMAGSSRIVWALPVMVALGALLLSRDLWRTSEGGSSDWLLLLCGFLFSGVVGVVALAGRGEVGNGFVTVGSLSFGTAYFSVAVASLNRILATGPWPIALLLVIVWAGDSAAFYAGTRWGRRKLAPRISPNKTWLGSAAALLIAVGLASGWSLWQRGEVIAELLALAALTSVAAQVGDLIESMIKRSVGVKDSGTLLPGHGGMFDRIDALLLAAPVYALLLWFFGPGVIG